MVPVPLSSRQRALLTVGLGVVLVFAAVFAPIGALVPTYRYEVIEVSPDSKWAGHIANSRKVLTCVDSNAPCDVVSRVRDDGPLFVEAGNHSAMRGLGTRYRVVYYPAEGRFYQPHHEEFENGSVRLSLERISNRTAMEFAALRAASFPREFQRLMERGTVRTSEPIAGWRFWSYRGGLVQHDGRFYRQGQWAYHGPNRHLDELLRGLTGLAGIGLLLYGRSRHFQSEEE